MYGILSRERRGGAIKEVAMNIQHPAFPDAGATSARS